MKRTLITYCVILILTVCGVTGCGGKGIESIFNHGNSSSKTENNSRGNDDADNPDDEEYTDEEEYPGEEQYPDDSDYPDDEEEQDDQSVAVNNDDDYSRDENSSEDDWSEDDAFSEERINELSEPAMFHCIERHLDRWEPDLSDTGTFWDVLCFYCNFTDWINTREFPRSGENGEYNVIPNDLLKNAAYAFYADFDGDLPNIEDDSMRAHYSDEETTAIGIGDTSAFKILSQTNNKNEDGTLDVEYELEFWGGTPAGSYRVHFEPNSNYDAINGDATYYYRVLYVERTDTSAAEDDSDIADQENTDEYEENNTTGGTAFDEIIEEYKEALVGNESLYNESINDENAFKSVYPHVCAYAPMMVYAYNTELKYAYYDIDNNGTMELLIGGDDDTHCIMDIVTFDGNNTHGCFTNEWIGERNAVFIYNDGTIQYHGAGGAANSIEDLYRISSNGYDLELMDSYEADWNLYPDTPYFNEEEFLTPEEFDSITKDNGYISPEWHSFSR